MRIAIFGATGRTGQHVLRLALKNGFSVNALVRDPKSLEISSDNLSIFIGSPMDKTSVEKTVSDCDAIISCLNISRASEFPWSRLTSPETLLSTFMQNLVDVLGTASSSRIVIMSAWGVAETFADLPGWFQWMIKNSSIKYPYRDHERQENLLTKTNLEWTIVRPSGLTNAGEQNVRVSFQNSPAPALTISRSAVAKFIMDCIAKREYVRQSPTISKN